MRFIMTPFDSFFSHQINPPLPKSSDSARQDKNENSLLPIDQTISQIPKSFLEESNLTNQDFKASVVENPSKKIIATFHQIIVNSNKQSLSRINPKEIQFEQTETIDSLQSIQLTANQLKIANSIDQLLMKKINDPKMPFRGSVLVIKSGETILQKKYDSDTKVTNSENTPIDELKPPVDLTDKTGYHIGSLTKQFTAVAIMMLHQASADKAKKEGTNQSEFSVHDQINKHLPKEFQNDKWKDITVHQLLIHTSGLITHGPDDEENFYPSIKEIIATFQDDDLVKDSESNSIQGKKHHYSNSGYILLGSIIENLGKKLFPDDFNQNSPLSYQQFIEEKIFEPLKMHSSGVGVDSQYAKANIATSYQVNKKTSKLELMENVSFHLNKASAAGGIYSNLEDMKKWCHFLSLNNYEILRPEFKEMMFNADLYEVHIEPEKEVRYGYGVNIFKPEYEPLQRKMGIPYQIRRDNKSNRDAVEHFGMINGFTSWISNYPNNESAIVILSNNYSYNMLDNLSQNEIEKILFSHE